MTLWRLVIREICHRPLNFGLGVLSVAVAVGVLVAQFMALDAHDLRTQTILSHKEAEMKETMRLLEDEVRKITVRMGFNVLILPTGQELGDFYADGYASKFMPETYVKTLAESGILSVRHLLPSLEQKIKWTEQGGRTVVLVGTRGEVPESHGGTPIQEAVPAGKVVVGYELWNGLGLKPGDPLQILGETFTIDQCHQERGTKDDITVWVDLAQAQALLGKPGEINSIMALKCHCVGVDIGSIREELTRILPDTKAIEFGGKAIARAEARDQAQATALVALQAERDSRATLRQEREAFAAWFVPLVLIGCMAWVAFLAFSNARERNAEIGILRALGFLSRKILFVFLARAIFLGLLGAILGYGVGLMLGITSMDGAVMDETALGGAVSSGAAGLFDPAFLALILLLTPLLSASATWAPATAAARQDPAVVLREE